MKVHLAYGRDGLDVEFDEHLDITIARPAPTEPITDIEVAINATLDSPLNAKKIEDIIKEKRDMLNKDKLTACIVVSDHTRPVPSKDIVPPIIGRLIQAGIKKGTITILVATGLHRGSTHDELERMLGKDILDNCKIINHDAKDKNSLKYIGETSHGTPAWVSKHYVDADLKILTGYTDPHFFAGFAGGRKAIVPGISGEETIIANHSARHINHPRARFLALDENPLHEDALEIARIVGSDFCVNVCLDDAHHITKVLAGEHEAVHRELVGFMKKTAAAYFKNPFDVVIVNNGGYPLDLNLYQAVKSMAIGELAIKKGGTIITVNELSDGYGSDEFERIIKEEKDPGMFIQKLISKQLVVEAQWQVQILARIAQVARIVVVSDMPREEINKITLGLFHAPSVEAAVKEAVQRHGKQASILVLPAGPQVIPCIGGGDYSNPACEIIRQRCAGP
nr:nickel-dependent lactate racemase [Candidatus Sigynarchaeota archaeon]